MPNVHTLGGPSENRKDAAFETRSAWGGVSDTRWRQRLRAGVRRRSDPGASPLGIEDPGAFRVIRTTVRPFIDERDRGMWAQLITVRLKPGKEGDLPRLVEQLQATEQPGSGLLRSSAMQDQNDPSRIHMLVVFESEEKARERENDPRRNEGLQAARATMAEIFDGAPEFTDLTVIADWTP